MKLPKIIQCVTRFAAVSIASAAFQQANAQIVISEVYGGGGNSGAYYANDFIELYNPTSSPVDITGWAVQYTSAAGTAWQMTPLNDGLTTVVIPAYTYYLVQEGAGSNTSAAPLPTPDVIGTISMGGTNGKVALTNDSTALSGTGLGAASVIDFVGYGSATTYEGTGATVPASNTSSVSRNSIGTDTDNNAADFSAGDPTPGSPAPASSAPVAISFSPADDSTGVVAQANLVITFDQTVNPGSGNITIYNASDNSVFEAIPAASAAFSGDTVTVNPFSDFASGASYYVQIGSGVVTNSSSQSYPGIADTTTWNFTVESSSVTPTVQDIVISQYYEGTGANRYIELHNLTASPISLDGYKLAAWANAEDENWKVDTNTTDRITLLDGYTIPANGYFLICEPGVTLPGYAAVNHDLETSASASSSTDINGDDSVVLYNGTGFTRAEVVDAISLTSANEGEDISFYRVANAVGFDFAPGSSILDYPTVWASKTPTEVDAALDTDGFYLAASGPLKTLTLSILPTSFAESAGSNAATATVTRSGDTSEELYVLIASSNANAAVTDEYVLIDVGLSSATFAINAVDNAYIDGDKNVTITVQGDGYLSDQEAIVVTDDSTDAPFPVVINEVDSDTEGTDEMEFIELYNTSSSSVSLDGLVIVLYNGNNDLSYETIDLTGYTIPANSFFVVGSDMVANVDYAYFDSTTNDTNKSIQNGADAVALYFSSAATFPLNTPLTSVGLVDAVVYDTNDADDAELLSMLTPGKPQVNENANSAAATESIARVPDGGAAFNSSLYVTQMPTPGASNVISTAGYTTWASANGATGQTADEDHDGDGVPNGVEYFMGETGSGFTANPGLDSTNTVTWPKDPTYSGTYTVQTSPDLQTWTDVVATDNGSSVSYTLPTGAGRLFMRLATTPN